MLKLILAEKENQIRFIYDCHSDREIQGVFQPVKIMPYEVFLEKFIKSKEMGSNYYIVVHDGINVGYAYSNSSMIFQHNEVGVALIPALRNNGLGKKTHKMLMDKSIRDLQATRLMAFVSTKNIAEGKVLESCGFVKEGIMREAGIIEDEKHDIAIYAYLAVDVRGSL